MFSLIKTYKIWFALSGFLVAAAVVAIAVFGLRLGIDFRGGSLYEAQFENSVSAQDLRQELIRAGFADVQVQSAGEKNIIIKTKVLHDQELQSFKQVLSDKFGNYQEQRLESIGPTIGRELLRDAYLQIILVIAGIVLYITYSFRKIGKQMKQHSISSWRMGAAAILALLHDLIIPIGVFALLGKLKGVELDSLFVTALLTILGFSIHDTIVVFDRIRESAQAYPYKSLASLIDYSVNTTLARSINTSSTLIFVLIAMLLFGGETIFYFVLALLVGVTAGTYSSIFIASPILYLWRKRS